MAQIGDEEIRDSAEARGADVQAQEVRSEGSTGSVKAKNLSMELERLLGIR